MKLSTRATYGMRLCFMLAVKNGALSASQLAAQTDISQKYTEQLLAMLKKGGIVNSSRGKAGGYVLSRDPGDITVSDMLSSLGDGFEPPECVGGVCDDMYCPNRNILSKLDVAIGEVLESMTLGDMINDHRKRCGAAK